MSTHRWAAGSLAAIAALIGVLLLSGGQAYASLSNFSFVSGFRIGEISEGIAIDESTNDVYVYESEGFIYKFDENGNPVDFSGLGTDRISGVGSHGSGETEMAVDNSSGPAKGDIYLAGGSGVQIYGADGKKLGEITEVAGRPWGEVACGVAIDGTGHVYVGVYPSFINEYTPTANPVTNNDYTTSLAGLNEICEIAATPQGALYASTWTPNRRGPLVEFDSIHPTSTKQITPQMSGTVAVANSPGAELFYSHFSEIFQYDSSGNPLSSFSGGESRDYYTIAVNAKNGRFYGFNADENGDEARNIEIWQGVITPEVRTGQASGMGADGSATLNGTVNPEGVSVESCSFEYGAEASYGSAVPCSQAVPLAGSSVLPVSANISGLQVNHVYHYRLSTTDAHGTVNGADQTFTVLVRPTVEDQQPEASAVTRSTARLTGTIDPKESDTSYHFEYGTTESYGNTTTFLQTGSGSGAGDLTVNQQLQDLIPDTTYHYRLVAKNVAGIVNGADHTFTTGAPIPPAVVTGSSSGVSENGATISGIVNAEGLPTTYGFEIGTSTDYGPPTGLGPVGAGLSEAPVWLSLTGLLPGTTYHYRITATNIDGTTYGADEVFTTEVFASTFAEPPAPLPFVVVPAISFPGESKPVVVKKQVKRKAKKRLKARKRLKAKKKVKAKKKK